LKYVLMMFHEFQIMLMRLGNEICFASFMNYESEMLLNNV
jgi:hypothetical protein